jgi:FdhE protein
MAGPGAQTLTSPWAEHRRRGEELRDRHPHAGQVLALYLALIEVWEQAWHAAMASFPPRARANPGGAEIEPRGSALDRVQRGQASPSELAGWAAEQLAPRVVATTVQFGPEPLAVAVSELGAVEPLLAGWLAGAEQPPVERYLARAVLRGPLETLDAAVACAADPAPRGGRHCPACGGRPQLSYRVGGGDALVSGRRYLLCARCGHGWAYTSSACAACGETTGARRTVFAEHRDGPVIGRGNGTSAVLFPQLRVEACQSCTRYLIDVDLGLDARAVPEVDELAALPLDLYAAERGMEKIAPNLMGF